MRATIEVADARATLKGWNWTSRHEAWAAVLNSMLDPLGPSGSDPAPSLHEARRVVSIIGGAVVDYKLPKYVEGRVY